MNWNMSRTMNLQKAEISIFVRCLDIQRFADNVSGMIILSRFRAKKSRNLSTEEK